MAEWRDWHLSCSRLITNRQLAERLAEAFERLSTGNLKIRGWRAYR